MFDDVMTGNPKFLELPVERNPLCVNTSVCTSPVLNGKSSKSFKRSFVFPNTRFLPGIEEVGLTGTHVCAHACVYICACVEEVKPVLRGLDLYKIEFYKFEIPL